MTKNILINDFSEYIQVAKQIKPTYYKQKNTRIPKMYSKPNFIFKDKKLFNTTTEQYVIANKNKAGKPRMYKVNGQDLYNGRMHHSTRSKIVYELHEYFAPYVSELPVFTEYPIEITMEFVIKDQGKNNIDNDNKWLWQKAFTDTLTIEGKIIDDSPKYVSSHTLKTIVIDKHFEEFIPYLKITIQDDE